MKKNILLGEYTKELIAVLYERLAEKGLLKEDVDLTDIEKAVGPIVTLDFLRREPSSRNGTEL